MEEKVFKMGQQETNGAPSDVEITADFKSRQVPKRKLSRRKTLNYDMNECYSSTNTYGTCSSSLCSTQRDIDLDETDFKMCRPERKRVQIQRFMTGANIRVGEIAADFKVRVMQKRKLSSAHKSLNYDMNECYSTTNTCRTRCVSNRSSTQTQ
ncbi:hypothetical protein THAOC_24172 [Thalassiosira oceanica]|uniref:Uncharacterized protein n=1 Tax=Thalassiosira oceanica TaxID=159749 RepID=K0RQG2_THAOC|nr:hypothetical protein THAOC_24172 [Thalassiosira oceanica]|mmetsp:Transcript_21106/g.49546  ORF Transcript_21106/g.49546 Transcript_21106/m.49546 type:complete len:153 (+) Transcript_21106:257-715(+)|eukprot:EJK56013.1 hypothetical protein THAOC_24172 [Thalassiosira oceanica]